MLSLKDQYLRDCVSNYYICSNFCNRHTSNARVMQTHPVSSMMQPPQDSMHSHSSPVNNGATKGGRKTKAQLQFAPAPVKTPQCHSTAPRCVQRLLFLSKSMAPYVCNIGCFLRKNLGLSLVFVTQTCQLES